MSGYRNWNVWLTTGSIEYVTSRSWQAAHMADSMEWTNMMDE